jgi:hypothetical protein
LKYFVLSFILISFIIFISFQIVKKQDGFEYKNVPGKYLNNINYFKNDALNSKIIISNFFPIEQILPVGYDTKGKIDYTSLIQSAINKYDTVIFPDFPLLINFKGLSLKSNSQIYFKKGSKLIMEANSNTNYEILRLHNVTNVILNGPNIIGDRDGHTGTTGEWGFGISIRGSQNIKVYKAVIKDCWGDGIYLGSIGSLINKDIIIENSFLDNNRRNGISIISGTNVSIMNSLISNTNGTLPMCGIDIEPNNNSEALKNISIVNTITFNNLEDGISINLRRLHGPNDKNISINIKYHIDDLSNYAIGIGLPNTTQSSDFKSIEGSINVVNSVWKNNKVNIVRISDYFDNRVNISFIKPFTINNDYDFSRNKTEELRSICKKDKRFLFTD